MIAAPPPEAPRPRSSDTGSLKPGDMLSGKYKVVQLLGEGGMGEVFAAEDSELGRRVAIKVLRGLGSSGQAAAEERLRREARTLAAIGHPNIVQVFDIGRTATGAPFLVMELLEGETLFELMSRIKQFETKRAVQIIADVLSALQAVHAKGIVHRDMKPENVFLARDATDREVVKLLDLGVAKALVTDANTPVLTETGAIVGTPFFMAPEQAHGVPDIDGRADLYGVGGMLYALLAGRTPFQASNVLALLRMIVDTDPIPIEKLRGDLPPGLADVVRHAMNRDRHQRFPDAQTFLAALAPYATLIMPRTDLGQRRSWARRHRQIFMGGGLVAIAAALLLVLAGPPDRGRRVPTHRSGANQKAPATEPANEAGYSLPARPDASVEAPPRRVFLTVLVRPEHANVTLDGVPRGAGGFAVEPSDRPRKLVVWAAGHLPHEQTVIVQSNDRVEIELEPERPGRTTGRGHRKGPNGTYRGSLGISEKNPYGSGPP